MPITQYTVKQLQQSLQQSEDLLLLDVREDSEYAFAHIKGSVHIPLQQLPQRLGELQPTQKLVVICHHGVRSQHACQFLEYSGFNNLYNLQGGIDAWSVGCDSSIPRY
jgi:rhodanese-related sulfurtransferase